MTELLPCPFCGGENVLADPYDGYLICLKCSAEGPWIENGDSVTAWNTRAAIAQPVPAINNFCPRCGKRNSADLIHTCTPPEEAMIEFETSLQKAVAEVIEKNGGLTKTAELCGIDKGYLSCLASGDKNQPSDDILRGLGIFKTVTYRALPDLIKRTKCA